MSDPPAYYLRRVIRLKAYAESSEPKDQAPVANVLPPTKPSSRFDRIAAVDDTGLLDPAIEARPVVQRQINRQAEELFQILAGEIESSAEEDGCAHAKVLSDEMMQGTPLTVRLRRWSTGLSVMGPD